jgi:hypothetical protein
MFWGAAGGIVPAFVSVVGFAGALLASAYVARVRPERRWYDGRAAAESCKTLAWRYAVGGRPFGISTASDLEIDNTFVHALEAIIDALPFVSGDADDGPQITLEMRNTRALSLDARRDAYQQGRIADQQAWYTTKASYNDRQAQGLKRRILALEFLGLVAGVAAVARWIGLDVLGLVAASVAALTALLHLKQYETLARAYSVTAQELGSIRSLISHQTTEDQWADFVDQSEEAVSREHTLWRASRGVTLPTGLPTHQTRAPK